MISVIVVSYNMEREVSRTLLSLSEAYQDFDSDIYEILLVQNGGKKLSQSALQAIAPNIKSFTPTKISASPVYAINEAANIAIFDNLIIFIDGARIASSNLLRRYHRIWKLDPHALITCPAYHLGWDNQAFSVADGYNKTIEDRYLTRISWPSKPQSLFDIATNAGSNYCSLSLSNESNALGITKQCFSKIGGFDTRFDIPGGGLCNLEIFQRALCEVAHVYNVPSEGTFHQIHNGESTNAEDPGAHKEKREAELEAKNIKFDFNFVTTESHRLTNHFDRLPQNLGLLNKHFRLRAPNRIQASGAVSFKRSSSILRQLSILSLTTQKGIRYRKKLKKTLLQLRLTWLVNIIRKRGL